MLSSADIPQRPWISKNLITEQNYDWLQKKLNTSGVAFDATHGLGEAASNSSMVLFSMGGFDDQHVIADLKWVAPTTAGNEEIAVMSRCLTAETLANYYLWRLDGGVLKLTKVIDSVFTNLATVAWALPVDVIATMELIIVGSQLTGRASASGMADEELTASDSDIPGGGLMGFRSLTSSVWCSAFQAGQFGGQPA